MNSSPLFRPLTLTHLIIFALIFILLVARILKNVNWKINLFLSLHERLRLRRVTEREKDAPQFLPSMSTIVSLHSHLSLPLSLPHCFFLLIERRWWQQDQVSNGKWIQEWQWCSRFFPFSHPKKSGNGKKTGRKIPRTENLQGKNVNFFYSLVVHTKKLFARRKYRNQRPLMRHVHFHLTHKHTH